jgi:hypothetical protein
MAGHSRKASKDTGKKRFSKKELERLRGEKLSKREAMSLLGGPMMPRYLAPGS